MYDIDNKGIGEKTVVTMASGLTRGTDEGKPVKISASNTVALAGDNELFHGIVKTIEKDGKCGVALDGVQTVPYSGTAPGLGLIKLEADGAGNVKVDATNGREHVVLAVDTTNTLVTFKL